MKKVRNWVMDNDGKKPSQNARRRKTGGTVEEQTHGTFLKDWKGREKKADKAACDFLMRHVPWWHEFANGSKAEKTAQLVQKVNEMLKQGF